MGSERLGFAPSPHPVCRNPGRPTFRITTAMPAINSRNSAVSERLFVPWEGLTDCFLRCVMLNRERVLLELLHRAGRPLQRIELVKWAFVLRVELGSGGGSAFYEFLPFKQGPYSFTLKREMDALVRDGFATSQENSWRGTEAQEIPVRVLSDVRSIVARFRNLPIPSLVDYVYKTHPDYTVNSDTQRLAERPVAVPAVFTAGYEGLQIDAFLHRLIRAGIERLIDVRSNPTARRYGFHKSTLTNLCGQVGIEYQHVPELGIPSARRAGLDVTVDRGDLFEWYQREQMQNHTHKIEEVARWISEKPSVLVCMEALACDCHRSRLAERVRELTGLPVVHLGQSG